MVSPVLPYSVYVGCSLTHAPDPFKTGVARLKDDLRSFCKVLEFMGLGNGTPHDVYGHDIHGCVYRCDLMVAICDFPSTGLGYEIATQSEARKMPVLAVAHTDALVTALIRDTRQPGYRFERYRNLHEDVSPIIRQILAEMHARDSAQLQLFPSRATG